MREAISGTGVDFRIVRPEGAMRGEWMKWSDVRSNDSMDGSGPMIQLAKAMQANKCGMTVKTEDILVCSPSARYVAIGSLSSSSI